MSLELYDRALVAKINKWTYKTDIHVFSPDETEQIIRVNADANKDKPIQLPLISLSRSGGYEILNTNKRVLTYDGLLLDGNSEKTLNLNAIPINITYQVDVWARLHREADEYMRNLIFNIINYPTLTITIPYNSADIQHNATLRVVTDVLDNSQNHRLSIGQYTRLSIGVTLDDAYMWDARVRNTLSLVDVDIDA